MPIKFGLLIVDGFYCMLTKFPLSSFGWWQADAFWVNKKERIKFTRRKKKMWMEEFKTTPQVASTAAQRRKKKKNCHHHYMKLEIIMTTLYNYDLISFMVTAFICSRKENRDRGTNENIFSLHLSCLLALFYVATIMIVNLYCNLFNRMLWGWRTFFYVVYFSFV